MSVWSHRKGDRERREAAGGGAGAEQLLQDLSAPLGMGRLALDCREEEREGRSSRVQRTKKGTFWGRPLGRKEL